MFDRYSFEARRVVFYAVSEARRLGSPRLESEHLLLGLLQENEALLNRFTSAPVSLDSIRVRFESRAGAPETSAVAVDLPLSRESHRAFACANEEATRLSQRQVGPEHVLLGLLREERGLAAEILRELGLRLTAVREELARPES